MLLEVVDKQLTNKKSNLLIYNNINLVNVPTTGFEPAHH